MPHDATITKLEARVAELESELVVTKAILDASEAFTREATGYTIALFGRYLHEKGLIDAQDLVAYLDQFKGDPSDADDYHGEVVTKLASFLRYQMQYPEDFALTAARSEASVPDRAQARKGSSRSHTGRT